MHGTTCGGGGGCTGLIMDAMERADAAKPPYREFVALGEGAVDEWHTSSTQPALRGLSHGLAGQCII
jgi:hypothetical protein